MAAVSETIVREYFELLGFFVLQQRKFIAPSRLEDDEIDFFVLNPRAQAGAALPFVLGSEDLRRVERAVVVVKGWHSESFGPGLVAGTPEMFRFLEPGAFQQAVKFFGGQGPLTKLLVVPALPASEETRRQSIDLLRAKGLDGVIPFRAMLQDLINGVESNRNYQKSDLLQVIRIFKNYEFFKEPQLELFKPRRGKTQKPPAAP
jgi:hypothetical protein